MAGVRAVRTGASIAVLICVAVGAVGCVEPPPTENAPRYRTQILRLDPSSAPLKKLVGFRLALDGHPLAVNDLVATPFTFTVPTDWPSQASAYAFTPWAAPSAEEIRASIEAAPSVGPGGVTVSAPMVVGDHLEYRLDFTAPQPLLVVADCWSSRPQELIPEQLAEAERLAALSPPAGVGDLAAWEADVQLALSQALSVGDVAQAGRLYQLLSDIRSARILAAMTPAERRALALSQFVNCPTVAPAAAV